MGKKNSSKEAPQEGGSKDAEAVKAVKGGDLRKITAFLDKNPGCVNASNKKGQTLLMIAIESGAGDVADELLLRGAKADATDAKKQTALHYAMMQEDDLAAASLVKYGAKLTAQDDSGETAFHLAARLATDGTIRLAKVLLTPDEFNEFIAEDEDDEDDAPQQRAPVTKLRDVDVAKVLPVQDESGNTVLHIAASEPAAAELATFLLERVDTLCSPAVRARVINAKGKRGSALMQACGVGNVEIARAFLQAGADVEVLSDEGCTALHEACMDGTEGVVHDILSACTTPAFVNIKSVSDGSTALHYAALNGHIDAINALLEVDGIELNLADCEGETPMSIAWINGHSEVVKRLEARGVPTTDLTEANRAKRAVRPVASEIVQGQKEADVADRVKKALEAKKREKEKEKERKQQQSEEKEADVADRVEKAIEAKKNAPATYELNSSTIIIMVFAFVLVVSATLSLADQLGLLPPPVEG
eukprot:TRINITY_DN18208_c0_g1_i1.p1 TRINITY_DN18208_c0_g1~~TRINITY_DN18208_c0_g1_i1.p1  ORF type:complete len:476 (+),score=202.79 TRINITY_DN18208_c0_g1_i1:43-1470(+)